MLPLINFLIQQRFQQVINTSIREGGSEYKYEGVTLLYYYFQKVDIRRGESYIASPNWLANKGATINSKNKKDNKCFKHYIIIKSKSNIWKNTKT